MRYLIAMFFACSHIGGARAYSMGAYILQSCPKRLITERSAMMFHEALVQQASGNEHDLQSTVDALHDITEGLVQVCSARMGITAAEFHKHIDGKQWWMSADEAIREHAADAIIAPRDIPELTPFPENSSLKDLLKLLKGL